ncbi:hypothetical protein [Microbulbifer sp. JMSA003]|uniref:hypothetical protein n=1 Tax=Microbulbifer sp. JMSA003 TaxID=3243369 RepID=UPI004039EDD0
MEKKVSYREIYRRGRDAGNSYIMYQIQSSTIAIAIALPFMSLWQLYKQLNIYGNFSEIHPVYWFTMATAFAAATLGYLLSRYVKRAKTTRKQWISAFAFLGVFIIGFSGFAFIGALR